MSDRKTPQVIPFEVKPNPTAPGYLLVRVRCPTCGGGHSHGIPAGDAPQSKWGNPHSRLRRTELRPNQPEGPSPANNVTQSRVSDRPDQHPATAMNASMLIVAA
jgi:hypothetical protein